MSRKRSKKAAEVVADVAPVAEAIVEEEILAEGSGPLVSDEILAEAAAAAEAEHVEPVLLTETDTETDAVTETETALADAEAGIEADVLVDGEGDAGDVEATEGAALPAAAASMDAAELKKLIEALVFASDKPVTVQRLRQLTRVSDTKRLEATLVELQSDYAERGLILTSVSGGWQFRTRPQFSAWVQQLIAGRPVRLSRAQLETLAIIAYRQPITRPEIDDIRGVDSSATLKLLLDRTLIRVLGKKEEVGRPMLYGTTKEFLDFFSLGDLRELPTLREYSELTDESRRVMTDRLGIEPDANTSDTSANEASAEPTDVVETSSEATVDAVDASGETSDATDDASVEAAADATDDAMMPAVSDDTSVDASGDAVGEDAVVDPSGDDVPVEASNGDVADSDDTEMFADAPQDAGTLSALAEKYLHQEREEDSTPSIDVDAMPGILAERDDIDDSALSAEPLNTDDIVDSDDADAPDSYKTNESE